MAMRTFGTMTLGIALAMAGCGGGETSADETEAAPMAESAGDEELEAEPEPEPEPEPPRTGPGQLTVHNRARGANVGGTVQVLDGAGEVVAEGQSGQTFNLDSGTYRVTGTITDPAVLVDTPTRDLDGQATVPAGGTAEVHVDFPVARVTFNVQRSGRPVARWTMTLTRQGPEPGEPIRVESGGEHTNISPGRYDGTLRFGGQQIEVNGLVFQGGATQAVPVNVN